MLVDVASYPTPSWPSWSAPSGLLPCGFEAGFRPVTRSSSRSASPMPLKANLHLYKSNTERLELVKSDKEQIIMEDEAFASGGVCEAFRIWFLNGDGEKGPVRVAKRYKFKNGKQGFREDHVSWYMASLCIDDFNEQLRQVAPKSPTVSFIPIIRLMERGGEWYSIEDFLEGKFTKYNNIFGDVEHMPLAGDDPIYADIAAAFSHFSFHHSGNNYVVLDVQGVKSTYTDAAIISRTASHFGYTDTGLDGLQAFFAKHKCGPMCGKLGLKPVNPHCLPLPTNPKPSIRPMTETLKQRVVAASAGSSPTLPLIGGSASQRSTSKPMQQMSISSKWPQKLEEHPPRQLLTTGHPSLLMGNPHCHSHGTSPHASPLSWEQTPMALTHSAMSFYPNF